MDSKRRLVLTERDRIRILKNFNKYKLRVRDIKKKSFELGYNGGYEKARKEFSKIKKCFCDGQEEWREICSKHSSFAKGQLNEGEGK